MTIGVEVKNIEVILEDKKEFGDFIRFMRKSIGMNQVEFAEKLGIKPERISKYERCATYPRDKQRILFEGKIRNLVKSELVARRNQDNL